MNDNFPVGFIGLGTMGLPMARRLLAQGIRLVVHDLDEQRCAELARAGAQVAASPAEVADQASIVLASLPTPWAVEQVALSASGLVHGKVSRIFVDLSTAGPQTAQKVADALAVRGITAVDAPVSGGAAGAQHGTLTMMASGPQEAVNEVRELLQMLGKKIFYVGARAGMGQMMKLINNLLSATALAASCEGLALGARAGLDPRVMLDVLNASTGRNSATEDKIPRAILSRSFDLGFSLQLSFKDIDLCIRSAEALGVPMWSGNHVRQFYLSALAMGGTDMADVARCFETWAGAEIASTASATAAVPSA